MFLHTLKFKGYLNPRVSYILYMVRRVWRRSCVRAAYRSCACAAQASYLATFYSIVQVGALVFCVCSCAWLHSMDAACTADFWEPRLRAHHYRRHRYQFLVHVGAALVADALSARSHAAMRSHCLGVAGVCHDCGDFDASGRAPGVPHCVVSWGSRGRHWHWASCCGACYRSRGRHCVRCAAGVALWMASGDERPPRVAQVLRRPPQGRLLAGVCPSMFLLAYESVPDVVCCVSVLVCALI